ncbi:MAG: PEPxxWA-CTERM sorting domain-containing protein [Phenylobacterium sp.]|uniref:PEPxxWA-CTERM sorting domain-containing protein n=1 Tax=Phenylobacterium sp. TaxID=1871053 RepID=UPI001A557E98|nr:PEPxxWA-CTERM sorting domain-containing protein [Phenylobacterium sp.]MBL8771780.1 PEPxxWA-CTERM sorting domain-containing protein [Phenylobacterium sp.]
MNHAIRMSSLALGGALTLFASAAQAENVMTWSNAQAGVATCVVGQTCNRPGGPRILAREVDTEANETSIGASVRYADYGGFPSPNYGEAFASAEAGEGLLGLPVLKAFASGGFSGGGASPVVTSIDVASVQAIQGYTNTGETALVIPLNAFRGLVDFVAAGNPIGGRVGANIAVTTSAILDPLVAAEYWRPTGGLSGGQWTGSCGSTGALAVGTASVQPLNAPNTTQYLGLAATSCSGAETYVLNPGESFYVWATLGVLRSGPGVTDASHTFNITIAPEYEAQVTNELAPRLAVADGANLSIAVAAIPEPSTWALMILGFGAAGAALRRRRTAAPTAG